MIDIRETIRRLEAEGRGERGEATATDEAWPEIRALIRRIEAEARGEPAPPSAPGFLSRAATAVQTGVPRALEQLGEATGVTAALEAARRAPSAVLEAIGPVPGRGVPPSAEAPTPETTDPAALRPLVEQAVRELYPGVPAIRVLQDPEKMRRVSDLVALYEQTQRAGEPVPGVPLELPPRAPARALGRGLQPAPEAPPPGVPGLPSRQQLMQQPPGTLLPQATGQPQTVADRLGRQPVQGSLRAGLPEAPRPAAPGMVLAPEPPVLPTPPPGIPSPVEIAEQLRRLPLAEILQRAAPRIPSLAAAEAEQQAQRVGLRAPPTPLAVEAGRGLARGGAQIAAAIGTTIEAAGHVLDSDTSREVGQQVSRYWQEAARAIPRSKAAEGRLAEDPSLLLNPNWLVAGVAETMPSLAAAMVPAVGAHGVLLRVGGKLLPYSPGLVAKLAQAGAAITGGSIGGLLEGSSTYREVIERGGSPDEAVRAMTLMGLAAAGLNAIPVAQALGPGKSAVVRGVKTGLAEAVTEWLEEPTEAAILGDPMLQALKEGVDVLPVAFIAGLVGGAGVTRARRRSPAAEAVEAMMANTARRVASVPSVEPATQQPAPLAYPLAERLREMEAQTAQARQQAQEAVAGMRTPRPPEALQPVEPSPLSTRATPSVPPPAPDLELTQTIRPEAPAAPAPTRGPAPATFLGMQERRGAPPVALYNLTEAIPGHPENSTVSASTLEALGYQVPEPATASATTPPEAPAPGVPSPPAAPPSIPRPPHRLTDAERAEAALEGTFTPANPWALERFIRAHGGIAPSPTGDVAGEYAELALRFKNRRGLTPSGMAEAIEEEWGQSYDDARLFVDLKRLRQNKEHWRLRLEQAEAAAAGISDEVADADFDRMVAEQVGSTPLELASGIEAMPLALDVVTALNEGLLAQPGSPAHQRAQDLLAAIGELVDGAGGAAEAKRDVLAWPAGVSYDTPGRVVPPARLDRRQVLDLLDEAFPDTEPAPGREEGVQDAEAAPGVAPPGEVVPGGPALGQGRARAPAGPEAAGPAPEGPAALRRERPGPPQGVAEEPAPFRGTLPPVTPERGPGAQEPTQPQPPEPVGGRLTTKVVDAQGRPLRVYHGTAQAFQELDPDKADPTALYGPGFYFTDSPEVASGYTEKFPGDAQRLLDAMHARRSELDNDPNRYEADERHRDLVQQLEAMRAPNVRPATLEIRNPFDVTARPRAFLGMSARVKAALPPVPIRRMIDRAVADEGAAMGIEGVGTWIDNTEWAWRIADQAGKNGEGLVAQYADYILKVGAAKIESAIRTDAYQSGEEVFRDIERITGARGDLPTGPLTSTREALQAMGYDGIAYTGGLRSGGPPHRVWVAFDPGQIKGAFGDRPEPSGPPPAGGPLTFAEPRPPFRARPQGQDLTGRSLDEVVAALKAAPRGGRFTTGETTIEMRPDRQGKLAPHDEINRVYDRPALERLVASARPRFEPTPLGEQAVVPGTPGRQQPTTPLRPTRPQATGPTLLERGEAEAEQPRLFERRPAYTPREGAAPGAHEQAQAVLRDLGERATTLETTPGTLRTEGPVTPRGRPAGSGARTLALGIADRLGREGYVELRGLEAATPEQLAVHWQVWRDPRVELSHLIAVKGGRVVGYKVSTYRAPGTAPIPLTPLPDGRPDPRSVFEARRWLERLGADGYFFLHNHGTGTVRASQADLSTTEELARALPGFRGHVIIDSGVYATILLDAQGRAVTEEHPLPEARRPDPLLTPSQPHPLLGARLLTPEDTAILGLALHLPEGMVGVFHRDGQGRARAIQEMPVGLLANAREATNWLRGQRRASGGLDTVLFLPDSVPPRAKFLAATLREQGAVRAFADSRGSGPVAGQAPRITPRAIAVQEPGAPFRSETEAGWERQTLGARRTFPRDVAEDLAEDLQAQGQEVEIRPVEGNPRLRQVFARPRGESVRGQIGAQPPQPVEPEASPAARLTPPAQQEPGRQPEPAPAPEPAQQTEAGAGGGGNNARPPDIDALLREASEPIEPPHLTEPILAMPLHKQVVAAAEELFTRGGVARDRSQLISDQILDLLSTGRVRTADLNDVLARHEVSFVQFGEILFRPGVRDAARRLGALGNLAREVGRFERDPARRRAMEDLAEIAGQWDEHLKLLGFWRRLDNVRRGLMVSQLATAVRNFESQVGRVGLDVLDAGLQQALQRMTGFTPEGFQRRLTALDLATRQVDRQLRSLRHEEAPDAGAIRALHDRRVALDVETDAIRTALAAHPSNGLTALLNVFRGAGQTVKGLARGKVVQPDIYRQAEGLIRQFPRDYDRLFGTYSSDITTRMRRAGLPLSRTDAVLGQAERATNMLNIFNRSQEWLVRSSVFQAEMASQLRDRGLDLEQLVRDNQVGAIPQEAIRAAIDKALRMTFADRPASGSPAQKLISAMSLPGVTLVTPFPRFMVMSLKHLFEFSPLGLTRVFTPAEVRRIRAGDMTTLSRGLLGFALLAAAYAIRESDWGGERWYEIRPTGDRQGATIDVRPFNPFVAYLFAADLLARSRHGTLYQISTGDILRGIASVNVGAGTGLFLLDRMLDGLAELGEPQRTVDTLKQLGAQAVSGFLVPLQQVSDVLAAFNEEFGVVRERRLDPGTGEIKARIPGLAQQLPEAASPTRGGPIVREQPLVRQLTGLSFRQPKNPAERELDRFQFSRREILPPTGMPEADRLLALHLGPLVEERLSRLVESAQYGAMSEAEKGAAIRDKLIELRDLARERALREDPALFKELARRRIPGRESLRLEEIGR